MLKTTLDLGGSDLHLSIGSPPQVRVDGHLRRLDLPGLTPDVLKVALAYSVLTDAQKKKFEETWELDMAFGLRGVGRFRCNVFNQKGAVGAVVSADSERYQVRSMSWGCRRCCRAGRPTARPRARHRPDRQRQVDDAGGDDRPHQPEPSRRTSSRSRIRSSTCTSTRRALVNQRELHADTQSFSLALRAALREDPDVVLVGEMRDLETMEAAMKLAETGHLTMATLHTNSAAQTITRIIDAFPAHQQAQIRTQLSLVLEGIVCQALLPKASGQGRVAALEILVANPAIRNLIRDDKIHQIYGTMQAGQEKFGMQTMNQSLARLVEKKLVYA